MVMMYTHRRSNKTYKEDQIMMKTKKVNLLITKIIDKSIFMVI